MIVIGQAPTLASSHTHTLLAEFLAALQHLLSTLSLFSLVLFSIFFFRGALLPFEILLRWMPN